MKLFKRPTIDDAMATAAVSLSVYLMVGPPFSFVMPPILSVIVSMLSLGLSFGALAACAAREFQPAKRWRKYGALTLIVGSIVVILAPSIVAEYVVDGDVTPLQRIAVLLSEIRQ